MRARYDAVPPDFCGGILGSSLGALGVHNGKGALGGGEQEHDECVLLSWGTVRGAGHDVTAKLQDQVGTEGVPSSRFASGLAWG